MFRKNIKKNFPNWRRLQEKEKKENARQVLETVATDYDFSQPVETNDISLFIIDSQAPAKGMMTIEEMGHL